MTVGLLPRHVANGRGTAMNEGCKNSLVVPHEFTTVELLATQLSWLEQQDFDLALGVRYPLSQLATPKHARKFAKYAVAEIIERLDELSAASHNGRGLENLTKGDDWRASKRSHNAVVSASASMRPATSGPRL